jgi:hypothetical protein
MSDNNQEKDAEIIQVNASIPPQVSAADTSNQDDKVSTDPSGEKYIRSLEEE